MTNIGQDVADALKRNVAVPSDRVEITVQNGKVTLRGEVGWVHQRNAAANDNHSRRGVRNVISLIQIE